MALEVLPDLNRSLTIEPSGALRGECRVPGDKSISHRAVMLGSIAEGTTVIKGFLSGADNLSTIKAFRSMGVDIDFRDNTEVRIEGRGLFGLREPGDILDAGNSGTTARLISGILAGAPFFSVLTGDDSLRGRPMARVVDPLRRMGALISGRGEGKFLPLSFTGRRLNGIDYSSPVASAQVKSAILLAGLTADGLTTVEEPHKSRDHTERMLALFGADIEVCANTVSIKRGATPLKASSIDVPGDISSAAFLIVATLIIDGSEIVIKNVGVNPTRCGIIDILKKMGADIEVFDLKDDFEPRASIRVRRSRLNGVVISGEELLPAIDEFPVICVAAALAKGATIITGAEELRVKESDRISVIFEMLTLLGATVKERPDGIEINGVDRLNGATVNSYGDHRMAMSATIAALASSSAVTIKDTACVDVSFPGFFTLISSLRDG